MMGRSRRRGGWASCRRGRRRRRGWCLVEAGGGGLAVHRAHELARVAVEEARALHIHDQAQESGVVREGAGVHTAPEEHAAKKIEIAGDRRSRVRSRDAPVGLAVPLRAEVAARGLAGAGEERAERRDLDGARLLVGDVHVGQVGAIGGLDQGGSNHDLVAVQIWPERRLDQPQLERHAVRRDRNSHATVQALGLLGGHLRDTSHIDRLDVSPVLKVHRGLVQWPVEGYTKRPVIREHPDDDTRRARHREGRGLLGLRHIGDILFAAADKG